MRAHAIRLTASASALVLALGMGSLAHAGDSDVTADAPQTTAGGDSTTPQVTITAERRTVNLQAAPLAATVIGGDQLQERGINGLDDLQFHTPEALQPMIALLSVVAVLLLNLREAARRPDAPTRPATDVVAPIYEDVIRTWRHPKKAHAPLTVLEFYMAVARLGGHMNRKADGFPGWLTLWRGWQKLESMVEAVGNDRRKRKFV